jgi:hypothetical protein
MLNNSVIHHIIEKRDAKGKPVPFSMKFVKISTGEIVTAENVVCTSSHFNPRTYNIMFPNMEIRKVRHTLIVEINGQEVYH